MIVVMEPGASREAVEAVEGRIRAAGLVRTIDFVVSQTAQHGNQPSAGIDHVLAVILQKPGESRR